LKDQLKEADLEPDISPFMYYIDCFFELSTCRSSMSISPIPFTSIAEFATIYNVDDFEEFLYLMRRLDSVFIEHHDKEEKKNATKPNPS